MPNDLIIAQVCIPLYKFVCLLVSLYVFEYVRVYVCVCLCVSVCVCMAECLCRRLSECMLEVYKYISACYYFLENVKVEAVKNNRKMNGEIDRQMDE